MELKCLKSYTSQGVDMVAGSTTEGLLLSEEKKIQMITDFPERFALIEEAVVPAKSATVEIETKVPFIESKETGDSDLKKAARAKKNK